MQKLNIVSVFAPLVLTMACDGGVPVSDVSDFWKDAIVDNGINLNGINLNGINLNGINLNGINLHGINLNGINLNGASLSSASIGENNSIGGSLTAVRASDGSQLADVQLGGAMLTGQLSNSTSIDLRIDSVTWSDADHVYLYNVSMRSDSGWAPLCGTANGAPVPAIPTPGQWSAATGAHTDDPSAFTFACVNAAVGKCIVWGYQPWATKKECKGSKCRAQPLSAWLQACTRMVRADYCGDGTTHTRNGTAIDVWDSLGIQQHVKSSLSLEAEWAQDGGHCIVHTRWMQSQPASSAPPDPVYVLRTCPTRMRGFGDDACGRDSDFSTDKGIDRSSDTRHLLRNESTVNQ